MLETCKVAQFPFQAGQDVQLADWELYIQVGSEHYDVLSGCWVGLEATWKPLCPRSCAGNAGTQQFQADAQTPASLCHAHDRSRLVCDSTWSPCLVQACLMRHACFVAAVWSRCIGHSHLVQWSPSHLCFVGQASVYHISHTQVSVSHKPHKLGMRFTLSLSGPTCR